MLIMASLVGSHEKMAHVWLTWQLNAHRLPLNRLFSNRDRQTESQCQTLSLMKDTSNITKWRDHWVHGFLKISRWCPTDFPKISPHAWQHAALNSKHHLFALPYRWQILLFLRLSEFSADFNFKLNQISFMSQLNLIILNWLESRVAKMQKDILSQFSII